LVEIHHERAEHPVQSPRLVYVPGVLPVVLRNALVARQLQGFKPADFVLEPLQLGGLLTKNFSQLVFPGIILEPEYHALIVDGEPSRVLGLLLFGTSRHDRRRNGRQHLRIARTQDGKSRSSIYS